MNNGKVGKKTISISICICIGMVFFSLLLPQFFVYPVSADSSAYYVSTTGSDSNAGTFAHPWKTIQKAVNSVTAGDTVYIRGGTYNEKVTIDGLHGTSSDWITFIPYNNEAVVVNATGLAGTYDGIFLFKNDCSYIRISGLEITNTRGHGIFMYGGEITDIRIDNCTIHDCESSGIYCYSYSQPTKYVRRIEFDYNAVYDVNNGLSYDTPYSPQEAMSFSNVQGFNIHHNSLSAYGKEGIDTKSGSSDGTIHHNVINTSLSPGHFQANYMHTGIYIDGFSRKAKNIFVYNNDISGYGGTGIIVNAEESTGSVENVSVYNNVIHVTKYPNDDFLNFRGIDSCFNNLMKNIFIYSNSVYAEGNGPIRIFPDKDHLENVIVANNIFASTSYYLLYVQKLRSTETEGRLTLTNNLYYRYSGGYTNYWADGDDKSWGANYILGNPKYVNKDTDDLHLLSNSPAINNATATLISATDYDGYVRPRGIGYDIGAYEYVDIGDDTASPEISDMTIITSTPLDTEIGWENIICTVTDNVAVHEVTLYLTDPEDITTSLSMQHITGTSIYYYNTTLTQLGNYSYQMWADDTSSNDVSSTATVFSLTPNWDINGDGFCNVLDLAQVSNHYGETGNPGWIREDVDNNGHIQVLDFILASNHYGESWWV